MTANVTRKMCAKAAAMLAVGFVALAILVVGLGSQAAADDALSPVDRIAFTPCDLNDCVGIVVMDADGSNAVTVAEGWSFGPAWSPDGSRIALARSAQIGFSDILVKNQTIGDGASLAGPKGERSC